MENETKVLQANVEFSKNLYKILSKEDGNIFFSPISIHVVLSVLHQGARGDTADALLHTLHMNDSKSEGYKAVLDHLNAMECVKLIMANKIYVHKNKNKLSEDFIKNLQENYFSELELLEAAAKSKESAKAINDWVAKKTEDKIKNIVNEQNFNQNFSLMVINAIYFKGRWASQFQDSLTKKANFFLNKNNTVEVDMMYQKTRYRYKHDQKLQGQILEIPYKGYSTQMLIILPSEDSTIKDLESKLYTSDFSKILEDSKMEEVHFYLPKFKMEETLTMHDLLSEMGLKNIFDMKKANFEGMLEGTNPFENLFVSEIIQKTFIKVDEKGTEAAAATKASFMVGCAPGAPQPVIFNVNRPAVFMLTASHGQEKNILFYGRLANPQ